MAPGPLGYAYGTTSKQQSSSDYLSFFSLSLLQSASCLLAFVSCTWLCSWATLRACARRSASSLWDDVMSIFPLSESFLWRLHRCVTMTASNANIAFRTQAVVFEKKVINKPDILLMFRGHKGVQREWTTKLSEELTKPGTRSLLYRRQYWKLYGSRLALVRSWFPSQGFEVAFQGVQRSIPIAANLLVAFCALSKLLAWSNVSQPSLATPASVFKKNRTAHHESLHHCTEREGKTKKDLPNIAIRTPTRNCLSCTLTNTVATLKALKGMWKHVTIC